MAKDDLPTDKGKGKEPVKDEKTQAANGTTESDDKKNADGKKPEFAPGLSCPSPLSMSGWPSF